VAVHYGRYLAGLAHGDLGPSLRFKDFRVTELIASGLPVVPNYPGWPPRALAFLIGVPLGAWAAWRRDSPRRAHLMNLSLLGVVLPVSSWAAACAGVRIYWPIFRVGGYEPGR
jgi:oligopeptide transport system permease protein